MAAAYDPLDEFKSIFSKNKNLSELASADVKTKQVQATVAAVNDLLRSLMGPENAEILTEQEKEAPEKPVLKTYNTRTAFTTININGIPVWSPSLSEEDVKTYNSWNTINTEANVASFQRLELGAALGGSVGTLTGTLTLYARDPLNLMSILMAASTTDDLYKTSGFPIANITMGWLVEDERGKIRKIQAKESLPFLVTNVEMAQESNSQGATFTLSLQDHGSAILQNTGSSLVLDYDYPQNQLRQLLEQIIGVRLFTLDDLLLLASESKTIDRTFFRTSKSSARRLNSNCLVNIVDQLLGEIKCGWLPEANNKLESAIALHSTALGDIDTFRQKLKDADAKTQAELKQKITDSGSNIANTCRLIWVPYFPAEYATSSNNYYVQSWPFKGAFLLIPELLDMSAVAGALPLIYGPGGSRAPYFHGSAMNLQQKALNHAGLGNFTFGDVLALNISQCSLIAWLRDVSEESIAFAEQGNRLKVTNVVSRDLERVKREKQAKEKGARAEAAAKEASKKFGKALDYSNLGPNSTVNSYGWSNNIAMRKLIIGEASLAGNTSLAVNNTIPTTPGAGAGSAKAVALQKLTSRLNTFVNIPTNISMVVLGDPLLMRQGIGAFEVISYMPTTDGELQILNPIVTGVYFPNQITHVIEGASYTTTIAASKVPPSNLEWTQSISKFISDTNNDLTNQEIAIAEGTQTTDTDAVAVTRSSIFNVDLTNSEDNSFLVAAGTKGYVYNEKAAENSKTLGDLISYLDSNDLFNTEE